MNSMAYSFDTLIDRFIELSGSDMYLTVGFTPCVRVSDKIVPIEENILDDEAIESLLHEILDNEKLDEFYSTLEYNAPIEWRDKGRFRLNIFRQQQHSGLVIRRITSEIPSLETLNLPKSYGDLIMEKKGLILVIGSTGSGKSTSLAAMIGHRNRNGYGHILTIEDPIEYVHNPVNCIISQRDVGIDTYSFGMALKNALRQRPDVVMIGEIRDRDTMEHALNFSETGHLCVATLHAGNSCQALERILNFFPEEKHKQICYNMSYNLLGLFSQRLALTIDHKRRVVSEVMLNRGFIKNLIQEGKFKEIPEIMVKNTNEGMQTFDQELYKLYVAGIISEEIAISESDSPTNLQLILRKHQSTRPGGKMPEIPPFIRKF